MDIIMFLAVLMFVHSSTAAKVFHVRSEEGIYRLNYDEAHEACRNHGAHLATAAEVEELRRTNYSICSCGWTLDKVALFPMTKSVQGCGGKPGLHFCTWRTTYDAFCFIGDPVTKCSSALGIESGKIVDSQLYASSEFYSWIPVFRPSRWSARIARLHNKDLVNAWIPITNGRHQWLEVDLDVPTAVTGIVTQGASRYGKKMWVTSFVIKYSKDGENYKTVRENGVIKVFSGNVNNDGLKRNMFPEPILARIVRFVPIRYHKRIALRLELLGCDIETFEAGQELGPDSDETTPPVDVFLVSDEK